MTSQETDDRLSGELPQIFIVGMNGSGTTMLLDHLGSHSAIFGFPAETKSLPYFIMNEAGYGDLNVEANFERLWSELSESVFGGAEVLRRDIPLPDSSRRSAAGAFDQLMGHLARSQGKRIWCEKSPMHVHHLTLLAKKFPDARFIHVIRDGRDCAASFHRRWKFNPMRTIVRWKRAVRAGREQGRKLGARYFEVRYESITARPEHEFRLICDFLGLEFERAVLGAGRRRPNSTKPKGGQVIRNERSAVQYFGPERIAQMEAVAGLTLVEFGYSCGNACGDADPGPTRLRWWTLQDDVVRLGEFITGRARIFRPSKWGYIVNRIRSALRQKSSL